MNTLLVSGDVGSFLMEDPWVIRMLDNRRVEMGRIAPTELTEYVTHLGAFNFKGRVLDIPDLRRDLRGRGRKGCGISGGRKRHYHRPRLRQGASTVRSRKWSRMGSITLTRASGSPGTCLI